MDTPGARTGTVTHPELAETVSRRLRAFDSERVRVRLGELH